MRCVICKQTSCARSQGINYCVKYALKLACEHLYFQKFSGGYTPGPPWREGATPSRTHPPHGLRPCARALRALSSAVTDDRLHPPA
jgi:hypothetical protein